VATLPIRDRAGNALVDLRFGAEEEMVCPVGRLAVPASLVVVIHANAALMMFDSWRKLWELPGDGGARGDRAPSCCARIA
jgi:8-oxo-dGTP diphosphatase